MNWWRYFFLKNVFTPFLQGIWSHHTCWLWKVWAYFMPILETVNQQFAPKKKSSWILSACVLSKGPIKSTPGTNIFDFKMAYHKSSCTPWDLCEKEGKETRKEAKGERKMELRKEGMKEEGRQAHKIEPLQYSRWACRNTNFKDLDDILPARSRVSIWTCVYLI